MAEISIAADDCSFGCDPELFFADKTGATVGAEKVLAEDGLVYQPGKGGYTDGHRDGDYTSVLFKHEGWKEPVEFMHHCSTKWGSFLMSLKSLVETGEGAPAPRDVQISDWH